MPRAHTTAFRFTSLDYFVADLDDGGVRIGMVGGTCFDIPAGHAYYDRVAEASAECEVEAHFDELVSAYV